jgi:tetratricopeptide (TPR) repeat protein
MRIPVIFVSWLAAAGIANSAPDSAAGTPQPEIEVEMVDVETAIPKTVSALAAPAMTTFPGGIVMAVSSVSELAQKHVLQGLNHLHGGWDFEASRHFAVAMREDPECLLAHWGMIMALLNPSPETSEARIAAADRLYGLIDQGKGTELERGYAYGIVKYIEEGPRGAATAFQQVAERFPNDLQAAVFAALFNRGGFDAVGEPTPDQENAEKILLDLIARHPENPVPLNALLFIRAEGPELSGSLELARKLCRMAPDYPPYFHMLGHYEWRCGNHGEAASAFGRAATFFQGWMRANQAGVADCPEWVRSECYRIVSLVSRGDFETSYAAARQVAATPVPADRPGSHGARMLWWDAKTLPARILIHRGLRGNANEAAFSLPKPDEVAGHRQHTLAYWWIDGLRFILEGQQLLEDGKLDETRQVIAALTQHGEGMASTQTAARAGGELSSWTRAFRAMEVLASDLRGRLAMAGPMEGQGSAYNWFASAADRQQPAPMLMPPLVLSPMAARLGEYYMQAGKPGEAVEAFQRALTSFPNDMRALESLHRALEAAGMPAEAGETAKKIKALKSE